MRERLPYADAVTVHQRVGETWAWHYMFILPQMATGGSNQIRSLTMHLARGRSNWNDPGLRLSPPNGRAVPVDGGDA